MILNEYKNISNEVYSFSTLLYDKILNDSDNRAIQKSSVNGFLFIENNFEINSSDTTKWIFHHIDKLTITYVLYIAENNKEYNFIIQNISAKANSEADYEKQKITLVSGYINDYIASDLLGTIFHEVNHLYEYDNGREKRADLYDKACYLISHKDRAANIVGNALYFSFTHERDAFVHQFYGFLKQEEPNHLGFDELLKYSPYKNAYETYQIVLKQKDDNNILKWINYLGYTRSSYFKRLRYNLRKLYAKLKNAYIRYTMENRKTTEGIIHCLLFNEQMRIEESKQYGYEIKFGIEGFYNG